MLARVPMRYLIDYTFLIIESMVEIEVYLQKRINLVKIKTEFLTSTFNNKLNYHVIIN